MRTEAEVYDDAEVREGVRGRLLMLLADLDELGTLTELEARLYFAAERTLYPENEIFRPENLEATEARYIATRTAGKS